MCEFLKVIPSLLLPHHCHFSVFPFVALAPSLKLTTYLQHYWWQKRRIIQEITTYGTHRCAASVAPMSVGLP